MIIVADADKAGMEAAKKLADRLVAAGRKVRIAPPPSPGGDWNDALLAGNDIGELKRQIVDAPLYGSKTNGILAEVEPWDEPVEGAKLLDRLADVFNRHMVMPRGAAEALALWVVHCYALDVARHSPILLISSPTKRCGKSHLLSVLQLLTPRPLPAANVSPAAVFRVIEKYKPTLLIDETDTFMSENSGLRGILNASHMRSQAYTLRCVGDDYTPKAFSTWCPKAFAGIGRLHETLEDRSIRIELRRRLKTHRIERIPARDDAYDELRRKAARWALDDMTRLKRADPNAPDELSDRARDNWVPLLAIADLAGADWPNRARDAARRLSANDDDEGQPEMLL